jgi:hypothetical protein
MQAFWLALEASGCYWISAPAALCASRNLPEQIRRAKSLGFATPRTLLTTRPGHLRTFWQETGGQLVYRALSSLRPVTQAGTAVPVGAVPVSSEQLLAFEEAVSVPSLFHERLPATRFLQVVVIGEQVFAAQTNEDVSSIAHWWDQEVQLVAYEPVELAEACTPALLSLVRSYGLEFAAVQLALGPDAQLFFVSLDPVGSFLWLEQQCPSLGMSESLARQLIAGAASPRSKRA